MAHHSIQFKNSTRCTYTTSTPSFLCIFALIFLFAGYIGLSSAASEPALIEKQVKYNKVTMQYEQIRAVERTS